MDNKSILDGMTMSGSWHEKADDAVSNVLTIYSKVCDKFEKDKNYGKEFVKSHQYLMGQLTIAAAESLEK